VDDARGLFVEAAQATLANADPGSGAWRTLLARLDNDAEMTVRYIAQLLARRDQWLRHVVKRDPVVWRAELEALLASEIAAELRVARKLLDRALEGAIVDCGRLAARYLAIEGDDLNAWLAHCAAHGALPTADVEHVEVWRALADWLLVKREPRLRKTMDRRDGIPPKNVDQGRPVEARDRMLAALRDEPGVADALHVVRQLPSPRYDDEAWSAIEALLEILPQAAAQLLVVFAARGTVDYAQYTLAALDALGEDDAPSELLMRLDLAVDHLLVDEFQDTSDAQYRLIGKLTSGWTPGDGRTLFAVGDPMQSIYRFRDAEVRLFLEAREDGRVGHVPVQFLDLARNFRSQGHVVSWVNRVFPGVLAARNDPWSGAVAFARRRRLARRRAGRPAHPRSRGRCRRRGTPGRGARPCGARRVHRRRRGADPRALGARAHPAGAACCAHRVCGGGARFARRAPGSPGPRVAHPCAGAARGSPRGARGAARAVVRAAVARSHAGRGQARCARAGRLVRERTGRGRIERRRCRAPSAFDRRDGPAFDEHACGSLADRVRGLWLALGGPATVGEPLDLSAADDYFALLRTYESAGDVADWQAFVDELTRRFATSTHDVFARVKVMTLYKAKGLEFDTVVIPGLAETRSGDDTDLLRWRARPGGLLMATTRARDGDEDAVYRYLKWLATAEADHELGRILYVGVTRACRRLHLVAVAKVGEDGQWRSPSSRSPLGRLWDLVADARGDPPAQDNDAFDNAPAAAPPLRRLRSTFALPAFRESAPAPLATAAPTPAPPFEWARPTAAAVGTVSHRMLAQFSREPLAAFDDARVDASMARIRNELIGEGVGVDELAQAVRDVVAVVRAVRDDARGRWLFDPTHVDAISEWPLAAMDGDVIVHVTLDRTFVAQGVRWIVDFKTGRHEGSGVDAFLAREVERYRQQLERYARVVRSLDTRPIKLALYYPLVADGWREWAFEAVGTQATLF
jgi:hypothetical protein